MGIRGTRLDDDVAIAKLFMTAGVRGDRRKEDEEECGKRRERVERGRNRRNNRQKVR